MAPPTTSLRKQVKETQSAISVELDVLSRKYGADLFRLVGQRYFKNVRQRVVLQREIEKKEEELRRLQKKAGR